MPIKVSEAKKAAAIITKVTNQTSITMLYRCVELSRNAIRVCSEYGIYEHPIEIIELEEPKLIYSSIFLAVVNSCADNDEITLTVGEDGIRWRVGRATGRWSIVASDVAIPQINAQQAIDYAPPDNMVKGLQIVLPVCQATAVAQGLFGIVFDKKQDKLQISSSNGPSFVGVWLDSPEYPSTERIILRPPVPQILIALLEAAPCKLGLFDAGIFVESESFKAQLPYAPQLMYDLDQIVNTYIKYPFDDVLLVKPKPLQMFLNRAQKLHEKGTQFTIKFAIQEGQIVLSQESISSSSEEYFIAEGVQADKVFESIEVPGDVLITSITNIKEIVLDYLDKSILLLKGENPDFVHIIGGQTK